MPVQEPLNHALIILHAYILELIMDLFVAAYKLVLEVEVEVADPEIFILHYLMLNFFFKKQNLANKKMFENITKKYFSNFRKNRKFQEKMSNFLIQKRQF
jgi:hypothetical protein